MARPGTASRSHRCRSRAHRLARVERLGIGQRVPAGAVEHALGDEVRRAVGSDVGQADRDADDPGRSTRGGAMARAPTEDRQRPLERRGRVDQRAAPRPALVAGQPERHAARPQAAGRADRRVVGEASSAPSTAAGSSRQARRPAPRWNVRSRGARSAGQDVSARHSPGRLEPVRAGGPPPARRPRSAARP